MAVREIITPQNPILRKKANKVTNFADPKLQTLIEDMVETMHDAGGVGLAAPQVAVSQRVIVIQLPDDEESKEEYGENAGVLFVVINPEIVKSSEEMIEGVEACLSIPGYFGKVDRNVAITVQGQDRTGKEFRIKTRDWLARVFQHEIDHLNGVLYIDHAKEVWKASEMEENGETSDENTIVETTDENTPPA
ncbi:MAG: peptide deformylase [Chloroflexota bacterium]|nr:peptide deformylase [Chloroflexota bacterium]NOG63765.1 peptide deformylase [Chloroflexota bacterium]GIK65001.1 MAG: peptide deformylase [Chloroflexota bacterium]